MSPSAERLLTESGGEEIDVIFKEDFSLPSPYDSLRQGRVFVTPAGRYRVSVPLHGVLPDRGVRAFDIDSKADIFEKIEKKSRGSR